MSSDRLQSVVAVVIGVVLAAGAQLVMKRGLLRVGAVQLGSGLHTKLVSIVTSPMVLVGLAMYAISSVFYLFALSREDLSFVYPILALNFLLIAILSRVVLHETISPLRLAGIVIVAIGVSFIAVKG
jgi:drug/metabolite transporter (DMT)-like permease